MTITLSVPKRVSQVLTVLLVLGLGALAGMAVSAASAGAAVEDAAYTAVTPCAAFDSRTGTGPFAGPYQGDKSGGVFTGTNKKTVRVTGSGLTSNGGFDQGANDDCGIPVGVAAVHINIVAINPLNAGNVVVVDAGGTPSGGIVNYQTITPNLNNSNAHTVPLPPSGELDIYANCGANCQVNTVDVRGVVLGYYTDELAARVAALEAVVTPPPFQSCVGTYWTERTVTQDIGGGPETFRNEAIWTFSDNGVFAAVHPELETTSLQGAWEALADFQVQVTYLGFEFFASQPWVVTPPLREDLTAFRWDRLIEFSPDCTTLVMNGQRLRDYEPADGLPNGPVGQDPTDLTDGTFFPFPETEITGRLLTAGQCGVWFEPDDSLSEARSISSGVPKNHSICPIGDHDWSTFTLTAESSVTLETAGGPFPEDTVMTLRDAGGSLIEENDDIDVSTDRHSFIDRECSNDALPAGTYYVEVREFSEGLEIPSYTLDFTATECPALLAVAYVNDGVAGYQPGSDVMIAQLEDTDGSGTVTIGDTVRTNKYPKNKGVTATSPAGDFGDFTVTTHAISILGTATSTVVQVSSGSNILTFQAFGGSPSVEEYFEFVGIDDTDLIDFDSGSFNELLRTKIGSPSVPDAAIETGVSPAAGDQPWIDVDIFIP